MTAPRTPGPGADRYVAPELAAAEQLVPSGELLAAVEERIGVPVDQVDLHTGRPRVLQEAGVGHLGALGERIRAPLNAGDASRELGRQRATHRKRQRHGLTVSGSDPGNRARSPVQDLAAWTDRGDLHAHRHGGLAGRIVDHGEGRESTGRGDGTHLLHRQGG